MIKELITNSSFFIVWSSKPLQTFNQKKEKVYNRHGQSAARRPHAALGPFSGMRKSNIDLLLPEIWSRTVNKSIKRTKNSNSAE